MRQRCVLVGLWAAVVVLAAFVVAGTTGPGPLVVATVVGAAAWAVTNWWYHGGREKVMDR